MGLFDFHLQIAGIVSGTDIAPLMDESGMQSVVDQSAADLTGGVLDGHDADDGVMGATGQATVTANTGFCAAQCGAITEGSLISLSLVLDDHIGDGCDQELHILVGLLLACFQGLNVQTAGSPGTGVGVGAGDHHVGTGNTGLLFHAAANFGDVLLGEEQQVQSDHSHFLLTVIQVHTCCVQGVMVALIVAGIVGITGQFQTLRRGDVDAVHCCFDHNSLPPMPYIRANFTMTPAFSISCKSLNFSGSLVSLVTSTSAMVIGPIWQKLSVPILVISATIIRNLARSKMDFKVSAPSTRKVVRPALGSTPSIVRMALSAI